MNLMKHSKDPRMTQIDIICPSTCLGYCAVFCRKKSCISGKDSLATKNQKYIESNKFLRVKTLYFSTDFEQVLHYHYIALQQREFSEATGARGTCQCLPLVRSYGSVPGAGTQPTVPGLTYGNSTPARITDCPWRLTPARPPFPSTSRSKRQPNIFPVSSASVPWPSDAAAPVQARPEEGNHLFRSLS